MKKWEKTFWGTVTIVAPGGAIAFGLYMLYRRMKKKSPDKDSLDKKASPSITDSNESKVIEGLPDGKK